MTGNYSINMIHHTNQQKLPKLQGWEWKLSKEYERKCHRRKKITNVNIKK